jgi:MOSC domain-containing protein YiiM
MAKLLAINAGTPQLLPGSSSPTGIVKTPRSGSVLIDAAGVLGDAVLDRKHHGGPDQALYLYLQSDYAFWAGELGQMPAPGTFGENLTIDRVDGDALCIGDRFAIGGVMIEVTSHRAPCSTFARRMGDARWVRRFHKAMRPGAYLRVLQPGAVEAGMDVTYVPFGGERVTLAEVMALDGAREIPEAMVRRILATPVHHKTRAQFEALLIRP